MSFEGLSPRGSFKIVGEQIDGSFAWLSRTHLVEAKWVKEPVAGAEFGAFLYKVQGKTADTRGLFVSVNGYSPQAIMGLNSKGELRFVCIDGTHLLRGDGVQLEHATSARNRLAACRRDWRGLPAGQLATLHRGGLTCKERT